MARSFGQVYAGIWRDGDFRKLAVDEQWAYMMLMSQADISSCGLLSITLGRWSQYAAELGREDLAEKLTVLSDHRFIVIDFDTEEILVRTFVKWDGGYKNDNRRKAIIEAAKAVVSDHLKAVLASELDKLAVPHGIEFEAPSLVPGSPFEAPSNGLAKPLRSPKDLVKVVDQPEPEPEPLTLEPEPKPDPKAIARARFDEFYSIFPKHVAKRAAKSRWDAAINRGVDPDIIIEGARRYAVRMQNAGTAPEFIKQPDGWLLAGRWEDEDNRPARVNPTPWNGLA